MSKSRNVVGVLSYVVVGLGVWAVTLIMLGINPLLDSTPTTPQEEIIVRIDAEPGETVTVFLTNGNVVMPVKWKIPPPPPITERSIIPQLEVVANIIEARGNISDKEMRALKFLSTEAKPGDSIVTFKEFLNNN